MALRVTDGRTETVYDAYCIRPWCGCTTVPVSFIPVIEGREAGGPAFPSLMYDYRSRSWDSPENFQKVSYTPAEHTALMLKQIPGFAAILKKRHERLKTMYARYRKENRLGGPAATPPAPGRNDPCPCGSGKKYKKCCGK